MNSLYYCRHRFPCLERRGQVPDPDRRITWRRRYLSGTLSAPKGRRATVRELATVLPDLITRFDEPLLPASEAMLPFLEAVRTVVPYTTSDDSTRLRYTQSVPRLLRLWTWLIWCQQLSQGLPDTSAKLIVTLVHHLARNRGTTLPQPLPVEAWTVLTALHQPLAAAIMIRPLGIVPDLVLQPDTCRQVEVLVQQATHHGVQVMPAGSGRGDRSERCPISWDTTRPVVCIDLRRLHRIVRLNDVNRTITVEAG
ncbi:hypothetical protein IWQ60_000851 [Tieghemiomyces parasiticus]|uniref:FAD-binding PCMH-type domain-containing protein n=1 Tax=Tieghemiomyces parasiticus TaxID=78921 RepID=A0A9W8E2G3_9FUNG|nr:hypothetical protein IWQ60_000851 [Tieghemiomyces parasiticus]